MSARRKTGRGTRAAALALAAAAAFALVGGAANSSSMVLASVRVGNGGMPFAGDGPRNVTVSPNGDGLRDYAQLAFRLARAGRVTLQVLVDGGRASPPRLIDSHTMSFAAGPRHIRWAPARDLEPRTYQLRLLVDGYENARLVGRVLGVDAGFGRQSYTPNRRASLVVSSDARRLTVQLFQVGSETEPSLYSGYGNDELFGVPAGRSFALDWTRHRNRPAVVRLRVPHRPSGLYFARLTADDGRVGFAPFVLLPRKLGTRRVAVVFPTNTWQAYNHRDADGDGTGDTWYSNDSIYRNLGRNLLFTSTTNFLWRVEHRGHWLIRTRYWRALGRPEASLIGVQFLSNDEGKDQGHYLVVGAKAAPWAFRGTGLVDGDTFGHGGIEIDARTFASPPGTIVLATMRNLQRASSAEMTYYETSAGAKVFASGTLNFAGTALEQPVSALLENVWSKLSRR
ncbi:MAG TPA: N,N-dimethylformamidase beta subunit family domain-containing protein [Gaiellaceae bacterium]|nr:N,N-dimethylformamidase beta subunit family domain-containing protein [Gaiellaceae bacterium]